MTTTVPTTTTTDPTALERVEGLARDGFETVRDLGREHAPELTAKAEEGIGWLQDFLPEGVEMGDLVAGSAGAALGWATGGGISSVIMLGSLALAAKSAFIDGDYKMAATYIGGGLAASSLVSGNIGGAAVAGAATYAMNKFWPEISGAAESAYDQVAPMVQEKLGLDLR